MIGWQLILVAAAITATAVAVAGLWLRWELHILIAATIGSLLLIFGWRAIANAASWNGDFLRFVSIGDAGCLVAGAAAPALLARGRRSASHVLVPAGVGGIVGFVVNVVIL